MFCSLKRFKKEEDGAVTVDWVILTAAIVSFGVVTVAAVSEGSDNATEQTEAYMNNQDLSSYTTIQNVFGNN